MAQYKKLFSERWTNALTIGRESVEAGRKQAVEMLSDLQQTVEKRSAFILRAVDEIDELIQQLEALGGLDYQAESQIQLSQKVRGQVAHYRELYLPKIADLKQQAIAPVEICSEIAQPTDPPRFDSPKDFGVKTSLKRPQPGTEAWGVWLRDSRFIPSSKQPLLLGQICKQSRGWLILDDDDRSIKKTQAAAALDLLYRLTEAQMIQAIENRRFLMAEASRMQAESQETSAPLRAWLQAEAWTRLSLEIANWLLTATLHTTVPSIDWLAEKLEPVVATYNAATFRSQIEAVTMAIGQNELVFENFGKRVKLSVNSSDRSYRVQSWQLTKDYRHHQDCINPSLTSLEQLLLYWPYLPGRDPLEPKLP